MRTRLYFRGLALLTLVFALQLTSQAQQQQSQTAGSLSREAHTVASSAKTLDDYTQALRLCGQAMQANPTDQEKAYIYKLSGWTYNQRGEALVQLAENTAATDAKRAAEYEQAAVKDFDLAVRFDTGAWKPRFNRAVSVAMLGKYADALADLDFVIEQQPRHKNALFNRAEILLQLGEYEQASAAYASVIDIDPADAAAYAGRGIALSALGDSQAALDDLNNVVRLQPESASGYVDRADLYAAMGNWERAAGDYRVAIGLDDKFGRAYRNVAWIMATCPEKKFRNPELAVRAARKAIELDGKSYLGLDTYAAALASVGAFTQAAAVQQQAISAAPEGEKPDLSQRLALYKQERPYLEPSVESNVRLAAGEEPVVK